MQKPYDSCSTWYYVLPGEQVPSRDPIDLGSNATDNREEDEAMARHLLRIELHVRKLPKGTRVFPHSDVA